MVTASEQTLTQLHAGNGNPFTKIYSCDDIAPAVDALIDAGGVEKYGVRANAYWVETQRALYRAVFGYIVTCFAREDRNLLTFRDLLAASEVAGDNPEAPSPLDLMFYELETGLAFDPIAMEWARVGEARPDSYAVKEYARYKSMLGSAGSGSVILSCTAHQLRMMMADAHIAHALLACD